MKKLYVLFILLGLTISFAKAQNVGVSTNGSFTPTERLHVDGNARIDNALIVNPQTVAAAAAITVATQTTAINITATAGNQANAITYSPTPTAGQIMYVFNADNDAATFATSTIPAGGFGTFLYLSGSWRVVSIGTGGGPSGTAGGDLTGTYPNPTVATGAINSAKIADGTVANADLVNSSVTVTAGTGLSGGGAVALGGSTTLSLPNTGTAGTYGSATQVPVVTTDAQGRVTAVTNTTISGVAPGGAAGGDLSGTYPNPTVAKVNGATAPAAGALTTGNVLQVNGVSSLTYAPVNVGGGANYVTGTLPVGNGGTGAATLTGVVLGNGTSALTSTTTSAGIAGAISDETGTGSVVLSASPTFTGTPAAPTAAVNTNTTQVATTAFVLGQASSTTPNALGTAAVGTGTTFARADHTHPAINLTTGAGTTFSGVLPVANGGTGSSTQAWVDLTTAQTAAGNKTWSGAASFTSAGTGLAVTNNATVGGTFGVTGATTLSSTLSVAGTSTLTGNVGIGTSPSTYPLIVRTATATANARTTSLSNAIGDQLFELATSRGATTNASGDVTTQIGQAYNGGVITEGIKFIRGGGATDGAMAFMTNNSTERMRIDNAGGITMNNLAGTGNRLIQASSTGLLSATTIDPATIVTTSTTGYIQNQTASAQAAAYRIGQKSYFSGSSPGYQGSLSVYGVSSTSSDIYGIFASNSGSYGTALSSWTSYGSAGAGLFGANEIYTPYHAGVLGLNFGTTTANTGGVVGASSTSWGGLGYYDGTSTWAGYFSGAVLADKYVVQNNIDGTSAKGIYMWNAGDTNWGIYMGQSGAGKSLANGTATTGAGGFSAHAIRIRTTNSASQGLIYENSAEQLNFSVRGSDGLGYFRGGLGVGVVSPAYTLDVNGTIQGSVHYTSLGSGNIYELGDDAWFTDINVANFVGITGQQNSAQGGLRLGSNAAAYIYSDGSANIGVGNTAPGYKLDVSGTGNFTGTLRVGTYTLPNTDGASGQVLKTNGSGTLTWSNDNNAGGTVTSVTASSPLSSSGGTTPNISLSFGAGPASAAGGAQAQGNFGQYETHGTYQDFNVTPNYWGWNYVQNNINAPNSNSSQWYREITGLGSNYPGRGAGGYSLELAYPRSNPAQAGVWMRTVENGGYSSWTRIDANGAMSISAHMEFSPDDISGFTTLSGDDTYAGVTMPFSVTYGGYTTSSISIGTNGYVVFGTTAFGGGIYTGTLPNSSFGSYPTLFFYSCDLNANVGNNIRYGTVGTAPNRVFIIDFQENKYGTSDQINGQVQIHETSGLINVKYRGTMSPNNNGQNATIGFQLNSTQAYPITSFGKVLDDNRPDEGWSVCPIR